MDCQAGIGLAVDLVQEVAEVHRLVLGGQLADHRAGGDVQRGEQVDCAVPYVVEADAKFSSSFDEAFGGEGVKVVKTPPRTPRANSIMERWIGSCRREPLDRTLIWNKRHLMTVLREDEDFYNTHRLHRTLNQAAPLRPLPDGVTDLDRFRLRGRDRAGGVIHEYRRWQ